MKISYGILGLVIVLAVLASLWHVGSLPATPTYPAVADVGKGLRTQSQSPPAIKDRFDQPQSAENAPALPTPAELMIESSLAELPLLPDAPGVPRDTGPFIDADPDKPIAQPSGPDQPPQNAGEFVDAGGPPTTNSGITETAQNNTRIAITAPKPLQYP